MPMDTLTVDKPQVIVRSDPHDHMNPELRSARGVLWGVAAGGVLWCLIGSALWGFY
jgi:hypothetical protein